MSADNRPRPILVDQFVELPAKEALKLLEKADTLLGSCEPSVSARNGEVYLFLSNGNLKNKEDWRADGFTWQNGGAHKYSNTGKNHILKEGEELALRKFRFNYMDSKRRGFRLYNDDSKTLVHYMGDNPKLSDKPHGNTKHSDRAFVRTAPSVLHGIKEFKEKGVGPTKTYTAMCAANVKPHLMQMMTPRNMAQIINARWRDNSLKRLGKDDLFNLYLVAFQLADVGYVKFIELFPEVVVVFANVPLMKEVAFMFETMGPQGKMYVGYDTTFNLGDFYVSIVTCRHFMFKSEPTLPLMFMIHTRKYREMHERCWMLLQSYLKNMKAFGVPIITDRERGIIDAIETASAGQNPVILCWNHIKKDVKRWLTSNGYSSSDVTAYGQHITNLLQTHDEHEFDACLQKYRKDWTASFFEYFSKHLESDMKLKAARWVLDRHGIGNENGITNNISESMNNVVKSFNDRKENDCDRFVVLMYRLQEGILQNVLRGFCGLGDFHLKTKFRGLVRKVEDITWPKCLSPDDLMAEMKANIIASYPETLSLIIDPPAVITPISPKSGQEMAINVNQADCVFQLNLQVSDEQRNILVPVSMNIQKQVSPPMTTSQKQVRSFNFTGMTSQQGQREMAKDVIAKNRVSLEPVYKVVSANDVNKVYYVELEPKDSCSCEARGACYHIMATKLFLGLDCSTPRKEGTRKLRQLAKRFQGKKEGKAGRKRPKKGDYDGNPRKKQRIDAMEGELTDEETTDEETMLLEGIVPLEETQGEPLQKVETIDIPSSSKSPEQSPVHWWIQDLGLKSEDKDTLMKEGTWLFDRHIEAAMLVLKKQFPNMKGLSEPYHAPALDSKRVWQYRKRLEEVHSDAVQIHFHGSDHWVTSFKSKSLVYLLDSAKTWGCKSYKINDNISIQLSAMYALNGRNLEVCIPDVMKQTHGNCGVHAIANAVYFCFHGEYPANLKFRKGMREHIATCLERGAFTEFKVSKNSAKLSSNDFCTSTIAISCSCRLLDFFDSDMVQCDMCKLWFHCRCQGISDYHQVESKPKFFCEKCKMVPSCLPISRPVSLSK